MQVVSSGGGPKTLAGVVHSAILGAGGAWLLPCLHPVVPTEFSITAGFWWPKQTSSRGAAGAGSSHSGQQATKGDDTLTVTSWALWGGPDVALPKRHLVAPESQGKLLRKGLGGWERLGEAVFSHPDLPSKVRSRKVMARERSWDKIVFIFAESDISRTYLISFLSLGADEPRFQTEDRVRWRASSLSVSGCPPNTSCLPPQHPPTLSPTRHFQFCLRLRL